jgi:hypothetical protein
MEPSVNCNIYFLPTLATFTIGVQSVSWFNSFCTKQPSLQRDGTVKIVEEQGLEEDRSF